jgi:uncharacterized protein YodC (DUF2158 family)
MQIVEMNDRDQPIKKGDIAHLRSGGPDMTFGLIDGEQVRCKWFERDKLREAMFDLSDLFRGSYRPPKTLILEVPKEEIGIPPWERSALRDQKAKQGNSK